MSVFVFAHSISHWMSNLARKNSLSWKILSTVRAEKLFVRVRKTNIFWLLLTVAILSSSLPDCPETSNYLEICHHRLLDWFINTLSTLQSHDIFYFQKVFNCQDGSLWKRHESHSQGTGICHLFLLFKGIILTKICVSLGQRMDF